jgi:putative glycerol-1-phosphate prenyltransferase
MEEVMPNIYNSLQNARQENKGKFIVLIDPDKLRLQKIEEIIALSIEAKVDYFFIGGSLIVNDMLDQVLTDIKKSCNIPLILFPGNSFQLSWRADAILFLSLISGRNPDLLIGKHVITAPFLKVSPLEIISTGYMLIDGGVQTSVSYMSNTSPIPADKNDISLCTAIAGELLGLKMIYMDAGSGAKNPISKKMIETVSNGINIPLIVGGGIQTPQKAAENIKSGADAIVVGTAIEKNPGLIMAMADAIHSQKKVALK